MRLDRCLTLRFVRPLRRMRSDHGNYALPVLMYHSISGDHEERVSPYYRVSTSPGRLAEHLRWLHEEGHCGVSLEEATAMSEEERSRRRPVALTFDDGLFDFYQTAWPILREAGCGATMFLPTGFVGSPRKAFRGRECLTWEEIREMRQAGVRFGSHTVSHPKLDELAWQEVARETFESKREIERELEEPITSFAYPYAFPQEAPDFIDTFSNILRQQGYHSCATTIIGRNWNAHEGDSFLVKRLPANTCDDRALFSGKLKGHYDWMGVAQKFVRHVRRRSHLQGRIEDLSEVSLA